jgi:hypothetical protein
MFSGYLELGGVEVLNQARAYTYVEESDCPAGWLRCQPCPGLEDALGVDTYIDSLPTAPWYDEHDPATHKFLGVYPIDVDGAEGSTRVTTIEEGILSGGVVTGTRRAVREMRVRAILVGLGHDGLDAGLSWLDKVLDGAQCSTHDGSCGEVDACYFITCPPRRPQGPAFTPWQVGRQNLHPNPSLEVNNNGYTANNANLFRLNTGNPAYVGSYYGRAQATSSAAFGVNGTTFSTITVIPGEQYVLSAYVRGNNTNRSVQIRATWTGATASSSTPVQIASNVDWQRISYPVTVPTGATALRMDLVVTATNGVTGNTLDYDGLMIERTATLEPYFDGDTEPTTDTEAFAWGGTVQNSVSDMAVRTEYSAPVSDAEYEEVLRPLRRRMHGVTAISGPLVLNHFHSHNGYHAYEVEFTLAATSPYAFTMPQQLQLPNVTPVVLADVPVNLVPYPSAELAVGTGVVVATNYSTNPSVEANATGWSTAADGAAILTANITGTRSNDIAANGSWSYRAQWTAPNSSSAGWFGGAQQVTIPTTTGIRFSINVWGYGVVSSGTATLGDLTVVAQWRNGTTLLRADTLGIIPSVGGAVSVKSIDPPNNANNVIVQTRQAVTSWSSGAVVNVYTDALAVTVP